MRNGKGPIHARMLDETFLRRSKDPTIWLNLSSEGRGVCCAEQSIARHITPSAGGWLHPTECIHNLRKAYTLALSNQSSHAHIQPYQSETESTRAVKTMEMMKTSETRTQNNRNCKPNRPISTRKAIRMVTRNSTINQSTSQRNKREPEIGEH